MATRNIVPRANEEGGLGTAAKKWLYGFIKTLAVTTLNALTLTAQTIGFTIAGGTTSKTLTVEGDSVIGSDLSPDAGPTFDHLHLTSGQIGFPATQVPSADPNTQDDYEEGTWVPGISFDGGTTGLTYAFQLGSYIKIGKFVWAAGSVVLSAVGSSVGSAFLAGLPFVSANVDSQPAVTIGYVSGITFADRIAAVVIKNDTKANFIETTNAGVVSAITNADFSNSSNFSFCICYQTNS